MDTETPQLSATEPGLRVNISVDLTDLSRNEMLEGVMHVTGELQDGVEAFAKLDSVLASGQLVAAEVEA